MMITLEGTDGAGKTTLAKLLAERSTARGTPARYLSKKTIPTLEASAHVRLENVRDAIWPITRDEEHDPFGTHFTLYLLAAWYTAIGRAASNAALSERVIVDGWYHRVVAKARLRGNLDKAWLRSLFAHVAAPTHVVLIDIEPALSFERRASFSPTEVGHWDGHRSGDLRRDFLAYQSRVRAELLSDAAEQSWIVVAQDGQSPEELASQIEERIVKAEGRVTRGKGSGRDGCFEDSI